jgi:1,4-dihydroxy-2-naphthoate octaprenyltransferase
MGTALSPSIDWGICLSVLLSALMIQIGTNLINDALDFKKGADTPARLGPTRVTSSGLLSANQVLCGGVLAFGMAMLIGIPLILKGGMPIFILMLCCCGLGYIYTGGPLPLAYTGLGDIFSFTFFGIVLTGVSYYLQTMEISSKVVVAGIQMGLFSTVMLAINNLRDVVEDTKTQKLTLAVRFGKTFVRLEVALLAIVPFILNLFYDTPWETWLAFPLALVLVSKVWSEEPGPAYNKYLAMGGLLQLGFGIFFVLGVVI